MLLLIFLALVVGFLICRATGVGAMETIIYLSGLFVVLVILGALWLNILLPVIRGQKQSPRATRIIGNLDLILAISGGVLAVPLTLYAYTVIDSPVHAIAGLVLFVGCLVYILTRQRSLALARARMLVFIFLATMAGILIFGAAGISLFRTVLYSALLFLALVVFGVLWFILAVPWIRAQRQPPPERTAVAQDDTGELALPLRALITARPGSFAATVAYLLAIAAAELIVVVVNPLGGIIFHIALLVGLVTHASFAAAHPFHKLYLALALAPLIRLLSLSMPLLKFPQIYWYGIVAVPLVVATIVVMRRLNYSRPGVGLTWNKPEFQLLIALTGIPFGIIEFYILKPSPLIDTLTLGGLLLPSLILLVGTGFAEELVFRGVMQRAAGEALGRWGWVYVAVLFGILHIGYLLVADVLFVMAVGLFYGWAVKRSGSLLGATLSHGITNTVLYLIMPFVA